MEYSAANKNSENPWLPLALHISMFLGEGEKKKVIPNQHLNTAPVFRNTFLKTYRI